MALYQTIVYPKNNTGNTHGLLNVTSNFIPNITLPYTYPNGSVRHQASSSPGSALSQMP
jgi:osomolarity two-component system, sensor histidine kinase SLN1